MSRDGDINTFMCILNYYTQSIPCFFFLFYQNKILFIARNIDDSPHFFPLFHSRLVPHTESFIWVSVLVVFASCTYSSQQTSLVPICNSV